MDGWGIVGVIGTLVIALPSFALGVNKVIREIRSHHPPDQTDLLDRLAQDKAEIMAHVTANRIQSIRHTNRMVETIYSKMEDDHGVLLGMIAEVDQKVSDGNMVHARSFVKKVS